MFYLAALPMQKIHASREDLFLILRDFLGYIQLGPLFQFGVFWVMYKVHFEL